MSPKKRWFDRTFETGQRDEMLPRVLVRLRSAPDRAQELLERVAPPVLSTRVEGTWSMLENIGHLHDLEALSERRLDAFERGTGPLDPADLENRATWDACHNDRPRAAVIDGFRQARERFVRRIESLPHTVLERELRHPRLDQPMRVVDLACFMADHDDHHLERVRELLSGLGHPAA